jgi:hypothetical protein
MLQNVNVGLFSTQAKDVNLPLVSMSLSENEQTVSSSHSTPLTF